LQGFLLQVEVSEIVVAETCEPDSVVDFLDTEFLSGQHGGDFDLLSNSRHMSVIASPSSSGRQTEGGHFGILRQPSAAVPAR
jgi:hypothetical protein